MKVVVTGGGGFLGEALCRRLAGGDDEVCSLSRKPHPALAALGVEHRRVDLADGRAVKEAFAGAELVFHVAAKAGIWGKRADYWRTNVTGTQNVLEACFEAGVRRLVYTSSPSVCFDGKDHVNAGNELPYPRRTLAHYPDTKAVAERSVLAANGRSGLATCALRPHLIFGPGDPHILPRLVERAAQGQLAIVGAGDNEVTLTYVDNGATAHVAAARTLSPTAPHAGKAYFIGQNRPVRLWPWINDLLARLDMQPVTRKVPLGVATAAGSALELVWRALRLSGEPRMTRFLAAQLATSHSYDMGPARRDFGYEPEVGMEEAFERTVAWLRTRG